MDGGHKLAGRRPTAAPSGVSLAALDKKLQLRKRAREDGARNHPRPEAQDFSEAEQAVVTVIAAEHAQLEHAREAARQDLERRLRALAPTPQDFTGPALEARLALKQAEGRISHDWRGQAERARAAKADLAHFRDAHGLRRAAVYPESGLFQAGLLLCAALAEALFSAALFAEDDARGLLGGAVTAIGLSGANVTLGFLAGFLGLRYVQHRSLGLRIAGAGAFALLGLMALMLNLFAADWRDRLAEASGALGPTSSDAGFHLWSLLQLDSPQAIILLMLGAGVWVFAALKGYSGFDDPYPDFGKMDRAAREAEAELSAFRAEARETLEAPIEAARAALSARLEKVRAEFEAMSRAFDQGAGAVAAFDDRATALDEAAASAIQLYRQENLSARTLAAPPYFGATPPSAGAGLDALAGAAAMVDEARALLAQAQHQFAHALQDAGAALDEASARLDAAAQ